MQTQTANPTQKQPKVISVQEVIVMIDNAAASRRYAFSAYTKKYSCFYEKLATIESISLTLAEAAKCVSDRQAISLILKTEKDMQAIAPRETSKLYKSFSDKINDLYAACRYALGREVLK